MTVSLPKFDYFEIDLKSRELRLSTYPRQKNEYVCIEKFNRL